CDSCGVLDFFLTRRSSDLLIWCRKTLDLCPTDRGQHFLQLRPGVRVHRHGRGADAGVGDRAAAVKDLLADGQADARLALGGEDRSEEHTSELQSREKPVCR